MQRLLTLLFSTLLAPDTVSATNARAIFPRPQGWGVWTSTTDQVMGGLSTAEVMEADGSLVFRGRLSLRNQGGFAKITNAMQPLLDLSDQTGISLEFAPLASDAMPLAFYVVLRDGSDYDFKAPFAVAAGTASQRVFVTWSEFIPEPRWGSRAMPCRDCQVDPSKVSAIEFSLNAIPGNYVFTLHSIEARDPETDCRGKTICAAEKTRACFDVDNEHYFREYTDGFCTKSPLRLVQSTQMLAIIEEAIGVGAPVYDKGYPELCSVIYAIAADRISHSVAAGTLETAKQTVIGGIEAASQSRTHSSKAWQLRHAFNSAIRALHAIGPESVATVAADEMAINGDTEALLAILTSTIVRAIEVGAPLYNHGKISECVDVYKAATHSLIEHKALSASRDPRVEAIIARLQKSFAEASAQRDVDRQAWTLRHGFDDSLDLAKQRVVDRVTMATAALASDSPAASDAALAHELINRISKAISIGAPMFNRGDHEGCARVYVEAARQVMGLHLSSTAHAAFEHIVEMISTAVEQAEKDLSAEVHDPKTAAWAMRGVFDDVLMLSRALIDEAYDIPHVSTVTPALLSLSKSSDAGNNAGTAWWPIVCAIVAAILGLVAVAALFYAYRVKQKHSPNTTGLPTVQVMHAIPMHNTVAIAGVVHPMAAPAIGKDSEMAISVPVAVEVSAKTDKL